jgi:hypothetical protein
MASASGRSALSARGSRGEEERAGDLQRQAHHRRPDRAVSRDRGELRPSGSRWREAEEAALSPLVSTKDSESVAPAAVRALDGVRYELNGQPALTPFPKIRSLNSRSGVFRLARSMTSVVVRRKDSPGSRSQPLELGGALPLRTRSRAWRRHRFPVPRRQRFQGNAQPRRDACVRQRLSDHIHNS